MAQAGVSAPERLPEALGRVNDIVRAKLGQSAG